MAQKRILDFFGKPQQNKKRNNRELEEADSQSSQSTPETRETAASAPDCDDDQNRDRSCVTSQVKMLIFQRHRINQLASVFQEGSLEKKRFVVHSMQAGLQNGDGSITLKTVIASFVSTVSQQWGKV